MKPTYLHILNSLQVQKFFESNGITIDREESARNRLVLVDRAGNSCELWAEVGAYNIPGIYIEYKKEDIRLDAGKEEPDTL